MIRHVVMWKLKDTAEGRSKAENARLLCERLMDCRDLVPGQGPLEVGIAEDTAGVSTFDVVLIADFESREALDAYQEHPTHAALKPFVAAVREARECVDFFVGA